MKRNVLRALMNIRQPGKMDESVLEIQNEFLVLESKEKRNHKSRRYKYNK